MAGFNKNKVELRSSSIKGMLRWWFRFYKSSFLNVDKLRKFENEVFGSTENGCLFYMRMVIAHFIPPKHLYKTSSKFFLLLYLNSSSFK